MALSLSSSSLAIKSISELSNKENAPGEKVTRIGSLRVPGLRSLSSFGVLGSSSLNDTKPEVKFELPNGEEVVLGECSGWSQSVAQVPVRLHVSNLPFRYRSVSQTPAHQLHLAFCQGTQLGAALQQGRVRLGG